MDSQNLELLEHIIEGVTAALGILEQDLNQVACGKSREWCEKAYELLETLSTQPPESKNDT